MINSIQYINGETGRYDSTVEDKSIRYGRNAVDNFKNYLKSYQMPKLELPDLSNLAELDDDVFEKTMAELDSALEKTNKNVSLDFEYTYSPQKDGKIDKMSLLGAAYEELGCKTSVKTQDLTKTLQDTFGANVTAQALDLNKDKKVDVAEYATSILLEDSLSSENGEINGKVTNKGQNESVKYIRKDYLSDAYIKYKTLYYSYGLDKAKTEFLSKLNGIKTLN